MQAKAIEVQGVWYLVSDEIGEVMNIVYNPVGDVYKMNYLVKDSDSRKVIAQSKQVYEGIPLFTPTWVEDVDLDKLADDNAEMYHTDGEYFRTGTTYGFIDGYNHHAEKYKYTEEDMYKAMNVVKRDDESPKDILERLSKPSTYSVTYEIVNDLITILKAEKK